jgi:hypothetical protein
VQTGRTSDDKLGVVRERSERIVLGLCVVLAAGHAALYLVLSCYRVSHPFELEWMESGSLEHVMRLLRGEALYVSPSIDFVPYPYPPFYYYLSAWVAKLVGADLATLRVVSIASSIGTAALIARFVARESGRSVYGWIAAGVFLGTWRASGLYFDVGRVDSLFTFLVIGSLYLLRFASGRSMLLASAGVATLAVMTKQTAAAPLGLIALWCVWADWRAHGLDLRSSLRWKRVIGFALPFAVGVCAATIVLEMSSGHFLQYVVGVQPGHAIKWGMIGWFFWHDLLLCLPLFSVAIGAWLGLLSPSGESPGRDERERRIFHLLALVGVLVACLVPRVKVGGAANNLILVHAWLCVGFGVAVARLAQWIPRARPRWGERFDFPLVVACALLLQLLVLARVPHGYLPSQQDLQAGRALAARIASIDGELLMPVQSHIAGEVGRRVFAHQMPVTDYDRSGLPDAEALLESYREAIRSRRFAAVVDSNTAFVRRYLGEGLLEKHYRLLGRLFEDPKVLLPVSGARIRAGTLWVPRADGPRVSQPERDRR